MAKGRGNGRGNRKRGKAAEQQAEIQEIMEGPPENMEARQTDATQDSDIGSVATGVSASTHIVEDDPMPPLTPLQPRTVRDPTEPTEARHANASIGTDDPSTQR
jgi:hypothetical protein